MRTIYIKLTLLVLAIVFFLFSIAFMLLNQSDNFFDYVPSNAEWYFHTKKNKLHGLDDKYKEIISDFLGKNSAMSSETWKNILTMIKAEVGIYRANKQITVIAKKDKKLISFLREDQILFKETKGMLYFPSLAETKFKKSRSPFAKIQQKINFSKFTLYLNNPENVIGELINDSSQKYNPIVINGRLKQGRLMLDFLYGTGQNISARFKPNMTSLPATTKYYFLNIKTEPLAKIFENQPKDIRFALLKQLNGPIEYFEDADGFTIFLPKDVSTFAAVEDTVKSAMAEIFPKERAKLLPDDSKSIELIADKNDWHLEKSIDNNNQQTFSVKNPKENLTLTITDGNYFYILSSTTSNQQKTMKRELGIINSTCFPSKLSKKSIVYISSAMVNLNKYINHLVFFNKDPDKIAVCID